MAVTTGANGRAPVGCRHNVSDVRPSGHRGQVAGPVGGGGHLPGRQRRPPAALLRPVHVPLPERSGSSGPYPQLHVRRPAGPQPHHARLRCAVAHWLRQFRVAGRERRHQDRHPPQGVHRRPHTGVEGQPEGHGSRLRLASRDPQSRPGVHAVEPGHLRAVPGRRFGLPEDGAGQLVPGLSDGAGQRAGAGRRHMRAQRGPGGQARPGAVVPAYHRVCRRAAGGAGGPGVARAGQDHAAQLDRPLRGGRVRTDRLRSPGDEDSESSPPGPTPASA